ncbi:MAG: glycosyltransferase family 2 protein [Methyloprofundus sp.]|nr:glycosyltransferase family 2 protein [Methyloprofundus sp.]
MFIRDIYMHQNNTESFELESQYSTTRCVMRTPPVIVNNSEDKFESVLFLPKNSERKAEGGLRTQGYFKHTQTDKPLISVITVVFNGEQYLEQTINSVIGQTYDNVEYIIIDGGSTDGTLDIIRRYEGAIDYWVSEGDEGIYDAMNKGISVASGEWLNFMNAGDFFANDKIIYDVFKEKIKADLIYGDHEIRYSTINKKFKAKSILEIFKGMIFCHQSMFVSKALQLEFPYEYEQYKFASDFSFIFRYITSDQYNIKYTNSVISSIEAKGESNINIFLTIKEYRSIVLKKADFFWIKIYFIVRLIDAYIREGVKFLLPEYVIDSIRNRI